MALRSKKLKIRGVELGQHVEWTVADGYMLNNFLEETDTGMKLKLIIEDRIIQSALCHEDDKKSYRNGLIDMYRYIINKRSVTKLENMDVRMKKEFILQNMPRGAN